MHQAPALLAALPEPGFAAGGCHRLPLNPVLRQARVAENDGILTEPAQMGPHHRDRDRRCGAGCLWGVLIGKVKAMEGQAFHQMAGGFRLKAGEIVVAEIPVRIPAAMGHMLEQLLVEGDDFGAGGGKVAHGDRQGDGDGGRQAGQGSV